ncbi:hypothetical protein PVAP13_8NG128702 [Panicum virgatum]|uniref:Uncharacterized protein n=1 Tax=Panicum virgatum TaxID=38727 RepID=A0A8T0P845_PANVG|nr:hypothetical protein PVAP13_8NG128702 [Panicum virgatum]
MPTAAFEEARLVCTVISQIRYTQGSPAPTETRRGCPSPPATKEVLAAAGWAGGRGRPSRYQAGRSWCCPSRARPLLHARGCGAGRRLRRPPRSQRVAAKEARRPPIPRMVAARPVLLPQARR